MGHYVLLRFLGKTFTEQKQTLSIMGKVNTMNANKQLNAFPILN